MVLMLDDQPDADALALIEAKNLASARLLCL